MIILLLPTFEGGVKVGLLCPIVFSTEYSLRQFPILKVNGYCHCTTLISTKVAVNFSKVAFQMQMFE